MKTLWSLRNGVSRRD